jgi:putative membrane protein
LIAIGLGVAAAASTTDGISYDSNATLFWVCFFMGIFNAILRPILILMTLPFVLLTLGLGVFVINALLILLVGNLVDGFVVASFWSALWAAFLVGIVNMLLNPLLGTKPKSKRENVRWSATVRGADGRVRTYGSEPTGTEERPGPRRIGPRKSRDLNKDDDVIDV